MKQKKSRASVENILSPIPAHVKVKQGFVRQRPDQRPHQLKAQSNRPHTATWHHLKRPRRFHLHRPNALDPAGRRINLGTHPRFGLVLRLAAAASSSPPPRRLGFSRHRRSPVQVRALAVARPSLECSSRIDSSFASPARRALTYWCSGVAARIRSPFAEHSRLPIFRAFPIFQLSLVVRCSESSLQSYFEIFVRRDNGSW